jgi:predicted nucleic acid-binding protein
MLRIVLNTTPIISLLKIGKLDILREIYGKVIVPEAVFFEIEKGKNKPFYQDISQLDWLDIQKIKNSEVLNLLNDLDAGEAEVIVLATEIVADLVIIDETLGRRFAKYSDLKVTGTIGVLIKAKEMGIVKAISPLLDEMQQKGIWINNKLKLKVLKKVNEESEQN